MKSSLFLSDLTVVDHGICTPSGAIIGGSFNPSFIVTGEIIGDEQVVVDFSKIKKEIKTLIDQHTNDPLNNGFDHKLLFINNFSAIETPDALAYDYFSGKLRININTNAISLSVPADAIRIVEPNNYQQGEDETPYQAYLNSLGLSMAIHVEQGLRLLHPDIDITVKCINSIDTHMVYPYLPTKLFTYSHGLKNSSSYGCQNAAHGHLSYLQVQKEDAHRLEEIIQVLEGAVFIYDENIIAEDGTDIKIEYTTERGMFGCIYNKKAHNVIVLNTETTIENIAAWVHTSFNIDNFYVSEGLSKGCYFNSSM